MNKKLYINLLAIAAFICLTSLTPKKFSLKDHEIIAYTNKLLYNETMWNSIGDGKCNSDSTQYKLSLFCALQTAYIHVNGKYKHRGRVMRMVRSEIKLTEPDYRFVHPIQEYNNMKYNSFKDISRLIKRVEQKIILDLK